MLQKDQWQLRELDEDNCDEELYVTENTVVWSRGCTESGGRIVKSFTLDTTIQQVDSPPNPFLLNKICLNRNSYSIFFV